MKFDELASKETVAKTVAALKAHGIDAEIVETKEAALERIKALIPEGADIMTGSSTTLNEIGFTDHLKAKNHPWKNRKDAIMAETDPAKQMKLRKEAILADYYLGSVHAVAETGQILVASASGSQLPSYAFSSPNVIWAVGIQKIVPDLDAAIKRLREYVFPLEDARMKSVDMGGSTIAKMLIIEQEPAFTGRKVHLIFINEKLGF